VVAVHFNHNHMAASVHEGWSSRIGTACERVAPETSVVRTVVLDHVRSNTRERDRKGMAPAALGRPDGRLTDCTADPVRKRLSTDSMYIVEHVSNSTVLGNSAPGQHEPCAMAPMAPHTSPAKVLSNRTVR